ncbi:Alpha/Beta hydrolase protein [Hyaloraphidium curvatum]|nr:Alpha/Beta hydrolase protein [Hyaloraphidium curvatum]
MPSGTWSPSALVSRALRALSRAGRTRSAAAPVRTAGSVGAVNLPKLWMLRRDTEFRKALDERIAIEQSLAEASGSLVDLPSEAAAPTPTLVQVQSAHRTRPIRFAYTIHGDGPVRLVFIAGLAADSRIWHRQVSHFARNPAYSVLLFDSWGVGFSRGSETGGDADDGPRLTTKLMAEDVAAFLERIGWTSFHAVGSSLGGMVLMNLCLVSKPALEIRSATFLSTSSGLSVPRLHVIHTILKHRTEGMTLADECRMMLFLNHPSNFLQAQSKHHPTRRNLDVLSHFWFSRRRAVPRTSASALLAQATAAVRHWVPRNRLRRIAKRLGDARGILVVTGAQDQIINPAASVFLARHFGPAAKLAVLKMGGHSVQDQLPNTFNSLLEEHVASVEQSGSPSVLESESEKAPCTEEQAK